MKKHSEQAPEQDAPATFEGAALMIITNQGYHAANVVALSVERVWIYRPQTAWFYSHHPSLAFFNGRYQAIWSNGRRDEDAPGQRVLIASSEDFLNWTAPAPLFDSLPGLHSEQVLTAAGFHQHDGQWGLYAIPATGEWVMHSQKIPADKPEELPENAALMKKQGYGQVEELMRNYGKIDVLWYDGGWLAHKGTDADSAWFWEPLKLNAMVRQYQPTVVINPRSGWEGDFQCDEGGHQINGPIIDRPWEKCLNLNQASWGYNTKQNLMSLEDILRMLVNVVGRGGNMLLNVGPDPDGVIPESHVERLKQIGDWLQVNGRGIYGTRPGPFQPVDQVCCTTFNGNKVYVQVLDWGPLNKLRLPSLKQKIVSSSILPGEAVRCVQLDDVIELSMLQESRGSTPVVVELVLDAPIN